MRKIIRSITVVRREAWVLGKRGGLSLGKCCREDFRRQAVFERGESGDGRQGESSSESHGNEQAKGKRFNLYEPAAAIGLLRAEFSPWRPRDLTICTKSADTTAQLTIISSPRGYIVSTRLITTRFQLIAQGRWGEESKILGTSTPVTQLACFNIHNLVFSSSFPVFSSLLFTFLRVSQ